MRSNLFKVVALILLVGTIFALHIFNNTNTQASWESSYDQQISKLKDQINLLDNQLSGLNQNLESVAARKNTLQEQVNQIREEIVKTNKLIDDTRKNIADIEDQIKLKEEELAKLKETMGELFIQIQKNQLRGFITIILSSTTLDQALSKLNSLGTLENELNRLQLDVSQKIKELDEAKQLLKKSENTLLQTQALNRSKNDQLNTLLEETKGEEARYQELKGQLQKQQDTFAADVLTISSEKQVEAERRAEAERKAALAARGGQTNGGGNNGNGKYNGPGNSDNNAGGCVNETVNTSGIGGGWVNPTSGFISQGFGCTDWGNGAHDAADIANGSGTPVYAANRGEVIKSGWRGGYGYSVVIKHIFGNRRIYTNYGHLKTQASVDVGQVVAAGELIGYMGSTGYSSGPHTHFSIADESYEYTGNTNCNPGYGTTYTFCFNPFDAPFNLYR
jgi:murein DD-endopeptidase MepM/ murein hydrolase activator NlpD